MSVFESFNNKIDETLETLNEMAVINPQFCRSHTLQGEIEQRDEGPIPHMHIYHDKTRNPRKCSYIRLDKAEYAPHHEIIKLPRNIKQQFIELMETPTRFSFSPKDGITAQLTGYQFAVVTWVDTFENGDFSKFSLDENGLPIMPDYSSL